MGAIFCFLPTILISSTYTDENNPCFRWTKNIPNSALFSHPSSNRTSSNCLSHKSPAKGCPYKISFKRNHWMFNVWPSLWPCNVLEGVSTRLDILTLEFWAIWGASFNFTWLYADTASAACPSQSGNLAMTSTAFAAVIWDADDPCSVKTA